MKNIRKVKVWFTIEPELIEKFELHIEEKVLDKSKLIALLIKEYMDKQK